jgi:hypothetical protein
MVEASTLCIRAESILRRKKNSARLRCNCDRQLPNPPGDFEAAAQTGMVRPGRHRKRNFPQSKWLNAPPAWLIIPLPRGHFVLDQGRQGAVDGNSA